MNKEIHEEFNRVIDELFEGEIDAKLAFQLLKTFKRKIEELILNKNIMRNDEYIGKLNEIHININVENDGYIRGTIQTDLGKETNAIVTDQDYGTHADLIIDDKIEDENDKVLTALYSGSSNKLLNKVFFDTINRNNENLKESDIEDILVNNLNIVEDGMTLIRRQYPIQDGFIDILALDKNNQKCIIEIKIKNNDSRLIQQSVYYPTQFNEPTRMITIAPGYTNKIRTSLDSLKYVEMKTYEFNENGDIIIEDFN